MKTLFISIKFLTYLELSLINHTRHYQNSSNTYIIDSKATSLLPVVIFGSLLFMTLLVVLCCHYWPFKANQRPMEFQDYASVTSEFSMTISSPAPVDAVPTQGMFQFPNLSIETNNRRKRLIEEMEGEEESQSYHSERIEQ